MYIVSIMHNVDCFFHRNIGEIFSTLREDYDLVIRFSSF